MNFHHKKFFDGAIFTLASYAFFEALLLDGTLMQTVAVTMINELMKKTLLLIGMAALVFGLSAYLASLVRYKTNMTLATIFVMATSAFMLCAHLLTNIMLRISNPYTNYYWPHMLMILFISALVFVRVKKDISVIAR